MSTVTVEGDIVVEGDQPNELVGFLVLDILDLAFDCCEDTLLPGDVRDVLMEVELGLVSGLHELPEHFDFLVGDAVLELDLPLDEFGGGHTARGIQTHDDGLLLAFLLLALLRRLHHVDHVVSFRDFLLFYLNLVHLTAELALPNAGLVELLYE